MRNRLLFIARNRENYSWGGTERSSGLRNSVAFLVDMLTGLGIEAKMVDVVDSNSIDREVTDYRPTHVILEAFWCPPPKITELKPLHPLVRWIVRDHSQTPFLATEGMAFEWIAGYLSRGVEIMCNSLRAARDMHVVSTALGVSDRLVSYGPNYYPVPPFITPKASGDTIDVGCFGAIRPLKNQMIQAIAAVAVAHRLQMPLRFHVNSMRLEGGADPVLRNLRAFLGSQLIEHPWLNHDDFLALMRTMDFSLQASFSETFNIVTADAVVSSVPALVSPEVDWLGEYAQVDPTDSHSIRDAMLAVWNGDGVALAHRQRRDLARADAAAEQVWQERFGS